MSRFSFVTVTLLLLSAATAAAQASAVEELVAAHYPAEFDDEYRRIVGADAEITHRWAFEQADLDGTGRNDYVAIAYCSGLRGRVRVLRATGGVVAETNYRTMTGTAPSLRLIDIDADRRPEIVAAFLANHGEETWVFKWKNAGLVSIGPTVLIGDAIVAGLSTSHFFDTNGDGIAELFGERTRSDDGGFDLYQLGPGGFVKRNERVVYANRFVRGEGEPQIFTTVFRSEVGKHFVIKVVNGDFAGNKRVTAGDIYFNGKQLLGPSDFKKKNRAFTFTVPAEALNEIEAGMEGKPGMEMTVTVADLEPALR